MAVRYIAMGHTYSAPSLKVRMCGRKGSSSALLAKLKVVMKLIYIQTAKVNPGVRGEGYAGRKDEL